ncbi:MAG: hypothetical protein M1828_005896 [Chrysothrix sp. TS-e1954]|nr:MAG: hypothetical protein M1828_005896 [Chrysothrix sp. TS-e1954]
MDHVQTARVGHPPLLGGDFLTEPSADRMGLHQEAMEDVRRGLELARTIYIEIDELHLILILDAIKNSCVSTLYLYEQLCDDQTFASEVPWQEQQFVRANLRSAREWASDEGHGVRTILSEKPASLSIERYLDSRSEFMMRSSELSARLIAFNYSVVQPLVDLLDQRSNREISYKMTKWLGETIAFIFDRNLHVIRKKRRSDGARYEEGLVDTPYPLLSTTDSLHYETPGQNISHVRQAQHMAEHNIELKISSASSLTPNFSDFSTKSTPQGSHLHVAKRARLAAELVTENPSLKIRERYLSSLHFATPNITYSSGAQSHDEAAATILPKVENDNLGVPNDP